MSLSSAISPLLTPVKIGPLEIPNRFVRSATHEFMADDEGFVTDRLVRVFHDLAEGEVGLIMTGHAFVRRDGKASPSQTAVYDDRFIPGSGRNPGRRARLSHPGFSPDRPRRPPDQGQAVRHDSDRSFGRP